MPARIDREYFTARFPSAALFGKKLTVSRREGFEAILDAWDHVGNGGAPGGLAYALATAWHETGATMQPVREGFKSGDAAAFAAVTAYCRAQGVANYAARHANGHSYYGRGYVQLTHGDNYKKMGRHLGVGNALYDRPDDVMRTSVGASILLTGMIEGLFRPGQGKLADYFAADRARWFDARDLINGDKHKMPDWAGGRRIGALIGDYGRGFLGALRYA